MTTTKVPGTKYEVDEKLPKQQESLHHRIRNVRVFAGSAGRELGQEIADYLGIKVGKHSHNVFANENIFIRLEESVRGKDVYLVQSFAHPVHDSIFELLIMVDALRRDSAERINVVIPYLAYARSDKKDQPRVPITARLLANIIEVAGADRYITIDLHAGQIQGFFNIPGDALTAFHLLSDHMKKKNIPELVVASTDLGFAKNARNWAEKLGTTTNIIEKRRRSNEGKSEALTLIGDVRDKNVLLVDDEVLTGGSVVNAVNLLRQEGARDIYLSFTHAILAGEAVERLASLNLKEIVTTNTIPIPEEKRLPNMTVLSVGRMLGEVVKRSHLGLSVGALFNE